ncbi:restriction endonuclease subunit S [Serratia nevei]|uniref:restriction endonuclease subunit S n=1 Tax=Serratia nevei TaxID=2703794 RepID=UPI00313F29F3
MVPEGWTKTLLGDVMEFKNGLNFTKDDTGEAIKIVGVANFKDLNELNSTEHLDIVRIADRLRDEELLTNGDLLFVRSNGNKELIGRCLYFPYVSERLSFSGFTIRGRAKRELVMPEYIAAIARSSFMKQQISKNGGGTNISNLSQQILKDIALLLPTINEQKRITQVLSIWDKAIRISEKILNNSQKYKKSLMQQLLTGKKRFMGFKEKWRNVKLAAVADMNSGGTPSSSIEEYYNGGIPWVSIADMTGRGKWISSTDKTLSKKGLENSSAKLYPENTVLYAMYASIGECSISRVPLCSSQAILGIRPKKDLHCEYLYYFLSSLKDKIKLQGQQGTQSNLNAGMVRDFIILFPSIEEQERISSLLNLADQEIEILKQKLNRLKQEKKALMQQLLTGKRRVKMEAA